MKRNNKKSKVILVDAGNVSDGAKIVEFLKANGISKIDYLIGTHIHEDHIGGIADIVDNISVKKIYMPYNVTIDRLKNNGNQVYITDTDGTIWLTSNGITNNVITIKDLNLNGADKIGLRVYFDMLFFQFS